MKNRVEITVTASGDYALCLWSGASGITGARTTKTLWGAKRQARRILRRHKKVGIRRVAAVVTL